MQIILLGVNDCVRVCVCRCGYQFAQIEYENYYMLFDIDASQLYFHILTGEIVWRELAFRNNQGHH